MENKSLIKEKKDFESCLNAALTDFKEAPNLLAKEIKLSETRKLKALANLAGAKELAGKAGVVICIMEKELADASPAIPAEQSGALKKGEKIAPGPAVRRLRQIYGAFKKDDVEKIANSALQKGNIPSSATFFKLRKVQLRENVLKRKEGKLDRKREKDYKIYNLSCVELAKKLKPESVDLILTDPPYIKDGIKTYKDLSFFAGKVLKKGGSLLALSGAYWLPQALKNLMECKDIQYHWLIHYDVSKGGTPGVQLKHVFQAVKCLWWFVKGEYKGEWISDKVVAPPLKNSELTSNILHKWGQNEAAMELILEKGFAFPGDSICDPFVGGGSVAIAALKRGCKFIGGDIDPKSVDITKGRIIDNAELFK